MNDAIDYFLFRQWAKQHFNEIREKNGKIRLCSIFCDALGGDRKYHLYCKPAICMYKCMKSGEKGSLYSLVMQVEQCTYDEAVDILEGDTQNLRYLEAKLDQYLDPNYKPKKEYVGRKKKLDFPDNSFLITSLGKTNHYRIRAEQYLLGRKIIPKGLMICVAGEYSNRIVIPYYDREGDLVYWNARDLNPNSTLRYRGPDSVQYPAAKKEEVVWMQYFPKEGTKIYLTEGEFDAMTLNECGLHAAAFGGASFNIKQFEMLRGYDLVLAFDADKAGENGIRLLSEAVASQPGNTGQLYYVRPAKPYKDWNEMYIAVGREITKLYVEKQEAKHQVLNSWNVLKLKGKL